MCWIPHIQCHCFGHWPNQPHRTTDPSRSRADSLQHQGEHEQRVVHLAETASHPDRHANRIASPADASSALAARFRLARSRPSTAVSIAGRMHSGLPHLRSVRLDEMHGSGFHRPSIQGAANTPADGSSPRRPARAAQRPDHRNACHAAATDRPARRSTSATWQTSSPGPEKKKPAGVRIVERRGGCYWWKYARSHVQQQRVGSSHQASMARAADLESRLTDKSLSGRIALLLTASSVHLMDEEDEEETAEVTLPGSRARPLPWSGPWTAALGQPCHDAAAPAHTSGNPGSGSAVDVGTAVRDAFITMDSIA